ncbi:MAG: hypothetical protein Q4G60_03860, partial [bacterium]|nr:hypothetical protein [bacterium]
MRTVHTPSFRMIRMTLLILAVICICILLGAGIGLVPVEQIPKDVPITTVSDVTLERSGQTETISLPYRITRLSPRETFQIDFTITPSDEDELYVKTVYAPLKVYADGELIYSYGTEGTYPSFFADPPTEVASLSLPKGKHTLPVTMVYEAPNARHSMVIAAPLLGSDSAITRHLTSGLGLSLLFAAVQIFMGILLILITLLLFPMDMRFTAPLWLGLFALVTGIWTASESNLTLYYTHHPSLFYMLAFMALFSITIPLYHFTMELLHLTDSKVLQSICLLQEVSFAVALLLQLTGLIPFSKSMYYFHLLLPLSVVFLAGYILYVGMCTRSITMKHFFFPVAILAVSSCMEVLNYQIRIINQLSSVFQIGILLFILFSELLAGRFLKDALMLREKNQVLSANLDMLEKQTDMQKERVALLLQNEAMVKQQRHDLKHQYAILSSFCEE